MTTNTGASGNGSGCGDGGGRIGSQHGVHSAGGAGDPALVARLRMLEEERAGLLAACRRMQAKAEAAAREVSVPSDLPFFGVELNHFERGGHVSFQQRG